MCPTSKGRCTDAIPDEQLETTISQDVRKNFPRFTMNYNLLLHTLTHTSKNPYGCDECNSIFSVKGNLKVHKRIHTGKKPYDCDQCNKNFKQSRYPTFAPYAIKALGIPTTWQRTRKSTSDASITFVNFTIEHSQITFTS